MLEKKVGWEVEGGGGRNAEAGFASDLSATCIMVLSRKRTTLPRTTLQATTPTTETPQSRSTPPGRTRGSELTILVTFDGPPLPAVSSVIVDA